MQSLRTTGLALFLTSLIMSAGCCYKVQNFGYTREFRIGKVAFEAPVETCNSCSTCAPAPSNEPPQAPTPKSPPLLFQPVRNPATLGSADRTRATIVRLSAAKEASPDTAHGCEDEY